MNSSEESAGRRVARVGDRAWQRILLSAGRGNELGGVRLVPLAEVLDERRLSAMAAHPSNQPPRSDRPDR